MGATNAYQCDGPDCSELTTKPKGARFPVAWPRVTVTPAADEPQISGSFHSRGCLDGWLDHHGLDDNAEPTQIDTRDQLR